MAENKRQMPKPTGQTGPKTAAGKARSSQNARKHGLRAKTPPLMAGESKTEHRAIQRQLTEEYQPKGPIEEFFITSIAMLMQKQVRIWASEAAAFDLQELPDAPNLPALPGPVLLPALEQERKILAELLVRLDEPVYQGESAYLKSQLDISPEEKEQAIAEAKEESYEFPEPWPEGIYYSATELKDLLIDLIEIYPLAVLPEDFKKAYSPKDVAYNRAANRRLKTTGHPFSLMQSLAHWLAMLCEEKPDSDSLERYIEVTHNDILALMKSATARLEVISKLEADTQAAIAEAKSIEAQRRSLEKQSIPIQLETICRYQTATTNELQKAIDRLMSLQATRKDDLLRSA